MGNRAGRSNRIDGLDGESGHRNPRPYPSWDGLAGPMTCSPYGAPRPAQPSDDLLPDVPVRPHHGVALTNAETYVRADSRIAITRSYSCSSAAVCRRLPGQRSVVLNRALRRCAFGLFGVATMLFVVASYHRRGDIVYVMGCVVEPSKMRSPADHVDEALGSFRAEEIQRY